MFTLKHLFAFLALSTSYPFSGNAADISKQQEQDFKTYLGRVATAEAIDDPIQRCIAYPALPGIVWTDEHIKAHCRYHHEPILSFENMQELANKGDFQTLEATFTDYQMRHERTEDQSEIIHRAFEQISTEHAGELTAAWLAHSPENVFAITARAEYLRTMAWKARGARYSADTPKAQMNVMSAIVQQAIPLYQKAIKLDPKLLPAYIGLLNIAMADSEELIERRAKEQGLQADPECAELMRTILTSLKPRWGGDYNQMLQFTEKTVKPSTKNRPLNGQYMATIFEDIIDTYSTKNSDDSNLMHAISEGLKYGANEDLMDEAEGIYEKIERYDLRYMFIAQVIRFRGGKLADYNNLGNMLANFEYYPAAQKFLEKALELDPNNSYAQFNLAKLYLFNKNYGKAIEYAKKSSNSPIHRLESQLIMIESLIHLERWNEALPESVQATIEFPNSIVAWAARLQCELHLKENTAAKKSLQSLIEVKDPKDTFYDNLIDSASAYLKSVN